MSESESSGAGISLDELVALTDEMAALSRAGVPFESGLAQAARDLAKRPGVMASTIAQRMQQGESLPQVMADSPQIFPPAYRAVVEAGMRSGRLSVALEGLAESSQRTAELRRVTRAALVYPLLVAFAAYGLFIFSVTRFQPLLGQTYTALRLPENKFNVELIKVGHTAAIWGPAVALSAMVLIGFWWHRSKRANLDGNVFWRRSPFARLKQYGRTATFADVLALLIEHQTPLDQSLVLAAEASGDRELSTASHALADEIRRGGTGDAIRERLAGFPPLLGWLLANSSQQLAPLATALHNTAEAYRRRALGLDTWLRWYLPMMLTMVIGGIAVVLFAISLFAPWFGMLQEATFAK